MNQRAIEAGARAIAKMRQEPCAEAYLPEAAAVITAYESHLKADGFVVVPKEPTPEMNAAAFDLLPNPVQIKLTKLWGWPGHAAIYRAMIAAADKPRAPWVPPFSAGDRVHHIGRNENGNVVSTEDGEVVVEFDNKTPNGRVSVGRFDEAWFRTHEGWLIRAAQELSP